jgi:hypothetical protein
MGCSSAYKSLHLSQAISVAILQALPCLDGGEYFVRLVDRLDNNGVVQSAMLTL